MFLGRENYSVDNLLYDEILEWMSAIDRVLSAPTGSLLLAGRAGVGRREAVGIVSTMLGYNLMTPLVSKSFTLKDFSNNLKQVIYRFVILCVCS